MFNRSCGTCAFGENQRLYSCANCLPGATRWVQRIDQLNYLEQKLLKELNKEIWSHTLSDEQKNIIVNYYSNKLIEELQRGYGMCREELKTQALKALGFEGGE